MFFPDNQELQIRDIADFIWQSPNFIAPPNQRDETHFDVHLCATVVINYIKSKDKAEELLDEIKKAGGKGMAFQADVRDQATLDFLEADIGVQGEGESGFSMVEICLNSRWPTNITVLDRKSDLKPVIQARLSLLPRPTFELDANIDSLAKFEQFNPQIIQVKCFPQVLCKYPDIF